MYKKNAVDIKLKLNKSQKERLTKYSQGKSI